jgi:hypothetical protein
MREVLTVKAGRNFQVIQTSCHARSNLLILSPARRLLFSSPYSLLGMFAG